MVQSGNWVWAFEPPYASWAAAMPRDINAFDGLGGSEELDMSGRVVAG